MNNLKKYILGGMLLFAFSFTYGQPTSTDLICTLHRYRIILVYITGELKEYVVAPSEWDAEDKTINLLIQSDKGTTRCNHVKCSDTNSELTWETQYSSGIYTHHLSRLNRIYIKNSEIQTTQQKTLAEKYYKCQVAKKTEAFSSNK